MKRLKIAAGDDCCKGMVLWPELSHSDTFMLEFFTSNAWSPLKNSLEKQIEIFCSDRYGSAKNAMCKIWKNFMPLIKLRFWSMNRNKYIYFNVYPFFQILTSKSFTDINAASLKDAHYVNRRYKEEIKTAHVLMQELANVMFSEKDTFIYRDIIDIARTIVVHVMFYGFIKMILKMEKWRRTGKGAEDILKRSTDLHIFMKQLSELIGLHQDYSLCASLLKLGENNKVNHVFENTLKGNAENSYCRSFIYELFGKIYLKEFEIYIEWVAAKMKSNNRSEWKRPDYFNDEKKKIQDEFYNTPLKEMAPPEVSRKSDAVKKKLVEMSRTAEKIISM